MDKPQKTVLEKLRELYPDSSMNTLRQWIKNGRVKIRDITVKLPNHILNENDELTLLNHKEKPSPHLTYPQCKIVYEDPHLVVVDKKAGVLSVASDFETANTIHSILKERYGTKVYVIHRLDQGTSGLLVFARTPACYEFLKAQLEKRTMYRKYIAIVKGTPEPKEGTWISRLFEDDNYRMHSIKNPNEGEEAITHYKTIGGRNPFTVIEATLETGKKNQIRVHCQDAGVPIVGDEKYGGDTQVTKRLSLHAHTLSFVHPKTRKTMQFMSDIPPAFYYLVPAVHWNKQHGDKK